MSTFSIGQLNQLGDAMEAQGWKADNVRQLGQSGDILKKLLCVLSGRAEIIVKSIISLVATVKAVTVGAKKTADCFINASRYYYRDSDLDAWLPEEQQEQAACEFSVQQLVMPGTFKQAVENFLGVTGKVSLLAKTLREHGHVTTLPVIESLVEQQEVGEDVGLRTDGWGNFFFVEKKAEEGEEPSVSVVYVFRYDGQWNVLVSRLGHDYVWSDEYRFFFRNKPL